MKDFKYCIWFCPDMNHMWNHFTNRFPAHLSLKTNLDYSTALDLYSKIEKKEIEVEFDNLMCDEHDGFHALFYTIKNFYNKPPWWPKNPHISFLYKYNRKITPLEVNYLYSNITRKKGILKHICVVKCSGHYSTWKILFSK
tara:strand:- start:209 stop:631 length:423 start_codon:yes stop_codon:yes gene_type:complete